jgi:hypothetical protein
VADDRQTSRKSKNVSSPPDTHVSNTVDETTQAASLREAMIAELRELKAIRSRSKFRSSR